MESENNSENSTASKNNYKSNDLFDGSKPSSSGVKKSSIEKKLIQLKAVENLDSSDEDSDTIVYHVESKSESESDDDWIDNSIILPRESRRGEIIGYHKEEHTEPPLKKLKSSLDINFNSILELKDVKKKFIQSWADQRTFQDENIDLISDPFLLCTINNFIENEKIVELVRKEMDTLLWNKRRLDLYEFFQTQDLVNCKSEYISKVYRFLKSDVMPLISEVTGLKLTKISASCSLYTHTDYLLVHDDLQGDRRIAFVFYITDPPLKSEDTELWHEHFGGALQLFSKDEYGHPYKPVKEIYPRNNQFVFFKVTNDSYHQVAEVKSMDYCRMSINGWFHGDTEYSEIPPCLNVPVEGLFSLKKVTPLSNIPIDLHEWITPVYLEKGTKSSIQKHVEENSEISLEEYFLEDKLLNVYCELSDENIRWKWAGPPNRRHYEVAGENTLPETLKHFLYLFRSFEIFSLLQDYTELDLIPQENKNPSVRIELQRWTSGCYSLMSEKQWFSETELDVIMFMGCDDAYTGGQVMYLARNEDDPEALVTLPPKDNTLNLVYRESETARVVQHIPDRSGNNLFYMIVCSYQHV